MKFKRKRRPNFGMNYLLSKVCRFCTDKIDYIDYKDIKILRAMITERGKIIPRRISGSCAKHQRRVNTAICRARNIALLPFSS